MRVDLILLAAGLAFTLVGCRSGHPSPPEVGNRLAERTHGWPYEDRERLVEGYRANFEKWTSEVDAREEELPEEEVEKFRSAADQAQKQMELALAAGPEEWREVRNEMASQLFKLHVRYNSIIPENTPRVPLEQLE